MILKLGWALPLIIFLRKGVIYVVFIFTADKNNLTITGNDLMTSGSVNVNQVQFIFSEDWEGLEKRAIFTTMIDGKNLAYELILEDGIDVYFLPWELLISKDNTIYGGVYGYRDRELVMPTERKKIGVVKESVLGVDAIPTLPWEPGIDDGGASGTNDHRRLTHRFDPNQHAIDSIGGLNQVIDNVSTSSITNSELEAILT